MPNWAHSSVKLHRSSGASSAHWGRSTTCSSERTRRSLSGVPPDKSSPNWLRPSMKPRCESISCGRPWPLFRRESRSLRNKTNKAVLVALPLPVLYGWARGSVRLGGACVRPHPRAPTAPLHHRGGRASVKEGCVFSADSPIRLSICAHGRYLLLGKQRIVGAASPPFPPLRNWRP